MEKRAYNYKGKVIIIVTQASIFFKLMCMLHLHNASTGLKSISFEVLAVTMEIENITKHSFRGSQFDAVVNVRNAHLKPS